MNLDTTRQIKKDTAKWLKHPIVVLLAGILIASVTNWVTAQESNTKEILDKINCNDKRISNQEIKINNFKEDVKEIKTDLKSILKYLRDNK